MIKTLLACLAIAALLAGVIVLGLSRLPRAMVIVEYPSGQCLAAKVVEGDKWRKVTCAEFEAMGGYSEPYERIWGARPE